MRPIRRKKLELARGHLEYLDDMITQTEVELYVRIKPYYEFVELNSVMPGTYAPGAALLLRAMNQPIRRNLPGLQKPVPT